MNKSLKKINLMGYMVFLKDGPHHQLMKVERRFKKKKEKKPKEEAFVVLGEWTSGGEESSTSSSDESNKTFTTRFNMGTASSSNICLMAKGMESDVSDDDSDSPSYEELLDLVHEQQRAIKKQSKKFDALNDLNATIAANYYDLSRKFQLLGKEHEELRLKIESIIKINNSSETSNSYNKKCHEDVFVESCDDLIAKENDELK